MTKKAQIIAVYSETGGITKTTTAVALATEAAYAGLDTVLLDLDPRGAATKWVGAEQSAPGLHVGAILAEADPAGWAEQMAVATSWSPRLRMIPSSRDVSIREKESADQAEIRLRLALDGIKADLVVIDCPNRQGGPLILNALTVAGELIIAARANEDGLDGIDGAMATYERYRKNCLARRIPEDTLIRARGIVLGGWEDNITPIDARRAVDVIRETWPGSLIEPFVPRRVIVAESRAAGVYFGALHDDVSQDRRGRFVYPKGEIVARSYRQIAAQVIDHYPTQEDDQA